MIDAHDARGPRTRRRTVLALPALAVPAALAACGSPAADGPSAATAAPVTLSFLGSSSAADRVQRTREVLDAFTAERPNIKVEIGAVPEGQNNQTAILVRAQSGDPLDVFEWPTYWHGFHTAGATTDLSARFKRDKIDPARFVPDHVANNTVDGKLHGVPISVSCDAWAYNLELLQQSGLAAPPANPDDKSWTMERFFEYAQKLTKPGQQWGFGGTHSGGGVFYHDGTFFGAGPWDEKARKMTVDTPAFRRGLEFWRDLETRYAYQPNAEERRSLVAPNQNLFLSGKIGFQGIFVGFKPDFRWGLATLPYCGQGRNVSGRLGLHSLFLGAGKQQDAAWTLASWFTQPQPGGRIVWALGHAVSPQLDEKASTYPQQVWRDQYGVDAKALLLQSRHSRRARWGLSTIRGWDDVHPQIEALNTRFRAGDLPTNDFVAEVTRLATRVLDAAR